MFHKTSYRQLPDLSMFKSFPKSTREAPKSAKLMGPELGNSFGKRRRTSESAAKIAQLKYHPNMQFVFV